MCKMNINEYEVKIKALFYRWKEAQLTESDEHYAEYRFGNVGKASFLPDGIIDYEAYSKSNIKVLFIAKEANWGGNDTNTEINDKDDVFWLQTVVKGPTKPTNFSNGIAMLNNAFITNNYNFVDENHKSLENIAFINLNKRGGYSSCSYNTLSGYTKTYADYIAEEIDLINPDIIICCGDAVLYLVNTVVKIKTNPRIIGVFHPSYFYLAKEMHLKRLYCSLNNKPFAKSSSERERPVATYKRGIIFDTNMTFDDAAVEEMLSPHNTHIAAFGKASENIDSLNIGDTIFYYHKGVGIIAAGKVIGNVTEIEGTTYRKREVEMIVPPIRNRDSYLGLKVNSDFRNKVKNENDKKGFYLGRTVKVPYLYDNEIDIALSLLKETLK